MKKLVLYFFLLFPFLIFSQEKIFYNAKIFTANRNAPFAEAIAIKGKKIVAVGNFAEVISTVSANAERTDLHGRFLMPGFVDSHNHAIKGGAALTKPNVDDQDFSIKELETFVKNEVGDKNKWSGDVMVVYGLNINSWSHLNEIIEIFNKNEFSSLPLVLRGSDGHTAWCNKVMAVKAGFDQKYFASLSKEEKQFYGFNGEVFNGFVSEDAFKKIIAILPAAINYKLAAEKAMEYNNRLGITAWLDPSAGYIDQTSQDILNAYQYLISSDKLSAHISATLIANANKDPASQIKELRQFQKKYTANNFDIIGFKIFADGVIEHPTHTAALSLPYTGTNSKGVLMFEPEKFASFAIAADKEDLLVHVHAIGDRAVTETLNGFEKMRTVNKNKSIPHTITHLQIVQPSDFDRFKKLNVLASYQLLWAFGDVTTVDIVKPYVHSSLYKWQYPARSMLQAGAIICGASDWPVSSADPLAAISRAETREGPLGVLDSSQRVPRLEMMYAYTINAAKALRKENIIGSLEPGKSADMILMDNDILTGLSVDVEKTKVVWTMFEGKIVYQVK